MSLHRQSHLTRARRRGLVPRLAAMAAIAAGTALALIAGQSATAGIVPTVPLATAGEYSVLAGTAVTNTGPSVIGQSVGLDPHPLTDITGFPPGTVLPPATIEAANGDTLQAKIDLNDAYTDARDRPGATETRSDLVGLTLTPGVYAAASKAPLTLSGELFLDGQGNRDAVFIFQTDSTLKTSGESKITLLNGAAPCNVFWQVGSSATLGTYSDFVGTILALTSITVTTGATVEGRALASNGAVTLDTNVFTQPSCLPSTATTTTTTAAGDTTATTTPATTAPAAATTVFTPTDVTLPATGTGSLVTQSGVGFAVLLIGLAALVVARRREPA